MKSSQESLDWYKKINDLWKANNFPIRFRSRQEIAEKVDFNIAKQVWRKAFRQEFPKFKGKLIFVKETSGNRYTTYKKEWNEIKVWINTSKGWSDLVHDLGHCIHYYKCRCVTGERPHNANHATMEWRITKLVFEGGYIEKSRAASEINAQKSLLMKNRVHINFTKIVKRKENLEKSKKRYETNLKRIATQLKEVDKKLKHYKKKYSEQELSATHVEKNLKPRKHYKSAKQFCLDSAEKYSWLNVWKDDVFKGETRIYVWHDDQQEQHEEDFQYGYFIDSWSDAKKEVQRLVEEVISEEIV
jgi:hypothetical protein